MRCRRLGFYPWVPKILWRRAWQLSSSILAWKITWTEEPSGLQSMRWQSQTQLGEHTHTQTHTHMQILIHHFGYLKGKACEIWKHANFESPIVVEVYIGIPRCYVFEKTSHLKCGGICELSEVESSELILATEWKDGHSYDWDMLYKTPSSSLEEVNCHEVWVWWDAIWQEITWVVSGHKKQLPADNQCRKQDLTQRGD